MQATDRLLEIEEKFGTLELSVPERIQLVEDIWDTISNEPEAVQLSDKEKK